MPAEHDNAPTQPPHAGPPWIGTAYSRAGIDAKWIGIACVMLVSASAFFGWRSLVWVLMTVVTAAATSFIMSLVMTRFRPAWRADPMSHVIAQAMLVALCLPPSREASPASMAGLLLGCVMPFVGRTRLVRASPVALVIVSLWLMPAVRSLSWQQASRPYFKPIEAVLVPWRVFVGDIHDVADRAPDGPWYRWASARPQGTGAPGVADEPHDAAPRRSPSSLFLSDRLRILAAESMLGNMMTSGELASPEEIALGCVPGPIGATSRALLVLIGAYLLFHRLASWRMITGAIITGLATLMLMPVGAFAWRETVAAALWDHDRAFSLAYVAYLLFSSPLPLILLVLAPMSEPMTPRGRLVYGAVLGSSSVAAMWLSGMPPAAFVGLVIAGAVSRLLDRFKSRSLARQR